LGITEGTVTIQTSSSTTGLHACGFAHKFTGKERDAESGLDYFGARYYASNMGRWMSPDWAAKAEPVPYAKLDDPQSLNLYSYVGNNPLSRADADGHDWLGELISYIAVHVATTGTGIASTRAGYNAAAKQATSPAARDALKTEYRGKGPALGRALADTASKDPARIAARAAKTDAELAATVGKTSSGANAFAETAGVVGKGAAGLAVGVAVYDVATAPPGRRDADAGVRAELDSSRAAVPVGLPEERSQGQGIGDGGE
jgi:RHS repeat-associated protein